MGQQGTEMMSPKRITTQQSQMVTVYKQGHMVAGSPGTGQREENVQPSHAWEN